MKIIHPETIKKNMDTISPMIRANPKTIHPKPNVQKMDPIPPLIKTIHPKSNVKKMDPIPPVISASRNSIDPISITKKVDTEKWCKICGYDYKYCSQFEIENHTKKHVGVEIPFKCSCSYCPRRFVCNSKLLRHIDQKHPEYKSKYSLNNNYLLTMYNEQ